MKPVRTKAKIWACPTPDCGYFFGSSTAGDLGSIFTGPKMEDQGDERAKTGSPYRHTRAACPDCKIRGLDVQRVPVEVWLDVPEGPDSPPLPSGSGVAHLPVPAASRE